LHQRIDRKNCESGEHDFIDDNRQGQGAERQYRPISRRGAYLYSGDKSQKDEKGRCWQNSNLELAQSFNKGRFFARQDALEFR